MERLKEIKEFIKECESKLKNLKSSGTDKADLVQMHTRLKNLENSIKETSDSKEKQEVLNDIDSLLFIVQSLLDYYDEDASEK